jgi:DNA-binding response OmpR family regulator
MKILIIENEYSYLETPFEYVNEIYFEKTIEYTIIPKSQDLKPFNDIQNFDFVFLDISLAKKSELDGFGILTKIKEEKINVKNIVIMTGNHLIKEKLSEKGLPSDFIILTKPIDFADLLKILKPN